MLSQLTAFFISIVVRINLSSQKMLQLHVQFITVWHWFFNNIKHPDVQEQHIIPVSQTHVCHRSDVQMQVTSIGNTEKITAYRPVAKWIIARCRAGTWMKLLTLAAIVPWPWQQDLEEVIPEPDLPTGHFFCSTPVFCITMTSHMIYKRSSILQDGYKRFCSALHLLDRDNRSLMPICVVICWTEQEKYWTVLR